MKSNLYCLSIVRLEKIICTNSTVPEIIRPKSCKFSLLRSESPVVPFRVQKTIRIHTYPYMYMCLWSCVRACVCMYIYMYAYIYMYIYTCIFTYMYIHIYLRIYTYIYIYIYVCVCVYIYYGIDMCFAWCHFSGQLVTIAVKYVIEKWSSPRPGHTWSDLTFLIL